MINRRKIYKQVIDPNRAVVPVSSILLRGYVAEGGTNRYAAWR